MTDYEVMAQRRDRDDAVRGYSIGGSGGSISLGSGSQHSATIRRSGNSQILEGFAVVYNKPHPFKGSIDVFKKGCFDRTLSTNSLVRFFIDHEHKSPRLGDTDSNLELVDSDVGLGFRLKLTGDAFERLDGRDRMSVCYHEIDVAECTMHGENVRLIKSAVLLEVSAVHNPAVKQTHAMVRDEADIGLLRNDVRTRFPSDGAAAAFQRALRNLQS